MKKKKLVPAAAEGPAQEAEYVFQPDDFELRGNAEKTLIDMNFASQNFWKEVRQRFFANKGAVVALVLIVLIGLLAAFGPNMTNYSYKQQTLSQKNFAPRIPGLENLGIFDGDESLKTTTGHRIVNGYQKGGFDDVYYWFGSDTTARDRVLARTVSGGVTVNDTLMHIAHENLPFGGVGESGWGAYHGETGFLRFTQQKPVLVQSRWAMGELFYPPYGPRFQQVMGLLKRWL